MSEIAVAIVVSPRDWAERLHRFLADHGGARVRRRAVSRQDALAEGICIVVVDDLTSFLSAGFVEEAHRAGRAVLGVFDPAEPTGRQRLTQVGVDDTIPADAPPEQYLRSFEVLAAAVDLAPPREISGGAVSELRRGTPTSDGTGARPGTLVAVGGPPGTGKTELAAGLAAALAGVGPAVVVDVDTASPSIAQRLGVPLHPNLRTAIDAVEHRGGSVEGCLAMGAAAGADVLAGLAAATDWSQVHPDEVVSVLKRLRELRRYIVADVGAGIEDLECTAGARYGVQRSVLRVADAVVIVAGADPVGVSRALQWAADLRELAPATPVHVAVNRVPRSRFRRAEIERELTRTLPVPSLGVVPADRRVEDAAWEGYVPTSGPFVRALGSLARAVARTSPQLGMVGSTR